uniref:Uncharacterized protein n=1 Tax=Leptobrachium leishanense TaxID=445787 RepID=A0A8C5MIJ6_9ANUR
MPVPHLLSGLGGLLVPNGHRSPSRQCSASTSSRTHPNSTGENNALTSGSSTIRTQCCSHLSKTWAACKVALCHLMSCGYHSQKDTEIYHPWPVEIPDAGVHNDHPKGSPTSWSADERNQKVGLDNSFTYTDLKLMGVPVFSKANATTIDMETPTGPPTAQPAPQNSREESFSRKASDPDLSQLNVSMSNAEIDGLIWQKLIELFSFHQIDELARCTSETVFLKKSSQIMELINNLTQDFQLEELDAECRLVQGIIRISTRKDQAHPSNIRMGGQQHNSRYDGMESGITLMHVSELATQDELEVQISEERKSDIMRTKTSSEKLPKCPAVQWFHSTGLFRRIP